MTRPARFARLPPFRSRASAYSTPTAPATCSTAPMSIPTSTIPAKAGTTISILRAQPRPTRSSVSATRPDCRRSPISKTSSRSFRSDARRNSGTESWAGSSSPEASTWMYGKTGLSQRRLQVEAGIRRLFRRDRPVQPENFPSEHGIGGAVDRLDADQLSGFVTKRRERALRGIAAHHDLIISGGQACDLQLVGALIAPEPRQAVIGPGIAGQPRRDATRLIGGVLNRFQPQRTAEARTGEQRAVADGGDIRIRGQKLLVDDDPRRDLQTSLRRELDIGQHADADHHEVRRHMAAVAEADAGDVDAIALDAGGLHAEMDANARRGVPILKKIRNFRGHRARHHPRAEFGDIHLEALGPRGGGKFQPDEPRADHDDALPRHDPLPQCLALVQRSQIKHVPKIGVGNVEQPVARAGGQHQMPVI